MVGLWEEWRVGENCGQDILYDRVFKKKIVEAGEWRVQGNLRYIVSLSTTEALSLKEREKKNKYFDSETHIIINPTLQSPNHVSMLVKKIKAQQGKTRHYELNTGEARTI